MTGAKPKPPGQKRHRVKSPIEWREVPAARFEGAPALPKSPGAARGQEPPSPGRPLGSAGLQLWASAWKTCPKGTVDGESLLVLCEQMDERVALRLRVIRDQDWRERAGLRTVDAQIMAGLAALGMDCRQPGRMSQWPAETRKWWKAISSMPHCALWDDADWQFALDTATLAAAFHAGDLRLAHELRSRERIMGTTMDARRDLRIRYVSPDGGEVPAEEQASVTALAEYRKMVAG